MKKVAFIILLSFFGGQLNATTMPIYLGVVTHEMQSTIHSHCEEAILLSPQDDSDSASKPSTYHYCCSVIAVLYQSSLPPSFNHADTYPRSERSIPLSNITESIYKPPKNYL